MSGQTINYEFLAKEALRSVVRAVLKQIKEEGLPGDHHFYISFHTTAPGVKISNRISAQYPREMTIVLQHQFWDLKVEDDYFEVRLSFSNIPELLVIPYSAVKVFFDPSVPYGLQFDQNLRPEAVEDKSGFIEDVWQMTPENSENPLTEMGMDDMKFSNNDSPDGFIPESDPLTSDEAEEISNIEKSEEVQDTATDKPESDGSETDSAEIVYLDTFRKT